jgi:hypothetical protein
MTDELQAIESIHSEKNMMNRLTIALCTAISCVAFSGPIHAAEGSVNSRIDMLLYYEGHGGLLVRLQTMTDLGGCGNAHWYLLPKTHAHYKEVVALVMSARVADLQLQVTVRDCAEGYGRVSHINLLP